MELEKCLDWIYEHEVEFKSQPLLKTTVDDVEEHTIKHIELSKEVMKTIDKIVAINEAARKESELQPKIFEMLSNAAALAQTVPVDLENRLAYLNMNKEYRYCLRILSISSVPIKFFRINEISLDPQ